MKFQHFIITRFNIRDLPFETGKSREEWEHWTRDRITLFLNYCLPSVLNQSNQNFTWLIFIDASTPRNLLEDLTTSSRASNIKCCVIESTSNFNKAILDQVKKEIEASTEWVIMTNLDNDDELHRDAIAYIQVNFLPVQDHLIYLASGFTYHPDTKKLSHYYYPRSPFLSLIEKVDSEMKGLFHHTHTQWPNCKLKFLMELRYRIFNYRNKKVTYIIDKPLWIQVIHGNNVYNNFYRGVPVFKNKNLDVFGIAAKSSRMELYSLIKYSNLVYWKRYLICSILQLVNGNHGINRKNNT